MDASPRLLNCDMGDELEKERQGQSVQQEANAVAALIDSSAAHHEMNMENFPESIYGAGMSFIVQSAATMNRRVHWLSSLIGLAMFANIVLQVFAIWSVKTYITFPAVQKTRALYEEFKDIAYDADGVFQQDVFEDWDADKQALLCQLPLSQPYFTLIILFIWTMSLVIEIKETILFSVWWLQLPPVEQDYKDVHFTKLEDETVLVRAASGRMKAGVIIAILLPKLVIGLFLWWMGARWLVATTDLEGLVLNAVALSFIVDLDEMTFHALVPHRAKRTMEGYKISVPPPQGDSDRKVFKWIAQMGGAFTVLIAVPLSYMYYFQQVLPGYRFDVHRPCEVLFQKQGF